MWPDLIQDMDSVLILYIYIEEVAAGFPNNPTATFAWHVNDGSRACWHLYSRVALSLYCHNHVYDVMHPYTIHIFLVDAFEKVKSEEFNLQSLQHTDHWWICSLWQAVYHFGILHGLWISVNGGWVSYFFIYCLPL